MKISTAERIYLYVGTVFVIMWMIISMNIEYSRRANNMEHIRGGYAYDKSTNIIYTEDGFLKITYTKYHDEDGCIFYYIPETRAWIQTK